MGTNAWFNVARDLGPVAALRRRQAPLRAGVALLFAVSFPFVVRSPWAWGWLAAYGAAQGLEVWALRPFGEARPPPPPWRTGLALAALSLLAAAFGSLALLVWRLPGAMPAAAAALMLCGGVLNVMTLSRGSLPAFAAGALPYAGLMVALPVSWNGRGHGAEDAVFALGAFTFLATAALMWRDGEALRRRELVAREDAERRRAEAEEAVAARAAFTAAVSHELRTPLSAIMAAASAVERRAYTDENRAAAALIADGARLMRRLLDDLLDLSKLEAGRMVIEADGFDLRALLEETARFWTPEAQAKRVALVVDGLSAMPRHVRGDALRLRQVLNNLLSNAVKFTSVGEVRLELSARAVGPDRWRVRLAVADTGPGLDDNALERLFTPFEQAFVSTARTHGGTGLGLAISRELARLMGGDIQAEDRRDRQGARFALELTLCAAAAPAPELPEAPAAAAPAPVSARGAGRRVLVVDDHPVGRQALSVLLGLRGCDVRLAQDAEAALELLAGAAFDLVLTDLHLGGLDGLGLVARLRAEPGPNRATPVVAVTGEGRPEVLAAARAAGFAAVVSKPVEPRALYTAVDAALTPASAASRAASAGSSLTSHSHTIATVHPAAASASDAAASRAVLRAILAAQ